MAIRALTITSHPAVSGIGIHSSTRWSRSTQISATCLPCCSLESKGVSVGDARAAAGCRQRRKMVITRASAGSRRSKEDETKAVNVDVERLVRILVDDMSKFDAEGISRAAYDDHFTFRDPITKLDGIDAHLHNVAMLRSIFRTEVQVHWAKQTGPFEIKMRWTVLMKFQLVPWQPELVFTGSTLMRVNPETGKFCSQVDSWDSIKNNDYLSFEGLWDVLKQLGIYKAFDLPQSEYQILKRMADYEVRKMNGGKVGVLSFTGSPINIVPQKERTLRKCLIRDGIKPKEGHSFVRYGDSSGMPKHFITRHEVLIWLEEFKMD